MSYRLVIEPKAERQLAALERRVRDRIALVLQRLAQDPYGTANVKALSGGGFRLRIGDYRVLFDILNDALVVLVVEVAHRREVYRRR